MPSRRSRKKKAPVRAAIDGASEIAALRTAVARFKRWWMSAAPSSSDAHDLLRRLDDLDPQLAALTSRPSKPVADEPRPVQRPQGTTRSSLPPKRKPTTVAPSIVRSDAAEQSWDLSTPFLGEWASSKPWRCAVLKKYDGATDAEYIVVLERATGVESEVRVWMRGMIAESLWLRIEDVSFVDRVRLRLSFPADEFERMPGHLDLQRPDAVGKGRMWFLRGEDAKLIEGRFLQSHDDELSNEEMQQRERFYERGRR